MKECEKRIYVLDGDYLWNAAGEGMNEGELAHLLPLLGHSTERENNTITHITLIYNWEKNNNYN